MMDKQYPWLQLEHAIITEHQQLKQHSVAGAALQFLLQNSGLCVTVVNDINAFFMHRLGTGCL